VLREAMRIPGDDHKEWGLEEEEEEDEGQEARIEANDHSIGGVVYLPVHNELVRSGELGTCT